VEHVHAGEAGADDDRIEHADILAGQPSSVSRPLERGGIPPFVRFG
jgi:hypothetical protein